MPEILKKIQQRILEFWGKLNKSQKIRLIITAAIILIAGIVSLVIVSRPTYVTLIKSSDTKQLKEITTSLDEQGIIYKMSDDGESIEINEKDKSIAQVATLEFVERGMDFEDAFNMIKINSTESDKEKLWAEYKRKNLSSKLTAIAKNIEMADIDLDIPEDTPFVIDSEEEKKPTARVIVKPKGELTAENVQAIAMMVAGSVSGLNYKDVVVLDDNLNVLNKENIDDGITKLNNEEEIRLNKAEELENRVYKLYGGPADSYDSIKVVANPYMDFDSSKSVINEIQLPEGMDKDSNEGYVISKSEVKEKAEEGGTEGVPGTDTNPGDGNVPNYTIGDEGNGNYQKNTGEYNYDYTRIQREEEKAIGYLIPEQSSIALALYYGRNVTDDTKMTNEFISQMIEGVNRATGVPVAQISVNKFKMPPLEEPQVSIADMIKDLVNDYGLFALMLLLILGLLLSLKPKKKEEMEEEESIIEEPVLLDQDEEPIEELNLEEKSEVKKQIDKFVKQKPDAVASLLRNWLTDEWD